MGDQRLLLVNQLLLTDTDREEVCSLDRVIVVSPELVWIDLVMMGMVGQDQDQQIVLVEVPVSSLHLHHPIQEVHIRREIQSN